MPSCVACLSLPSGRPLVGDFPFDAAERLPIGFTPSYPHTKGVVAVEWDASNTLFSCADDQTMWRWNLNGEPLGKLTVAEDTSVTAMHWLLSRDKRQTAATATQATKDVLVLGCSDGTFRMMIKGVGRQEKRVEAHTGAVVAVNWNSEGTSLATGGEDGAVKLWSRSGQARSVLMQLDHAILSLAWGPDADSLVIATGNDLVIRPLQTSAKPLRWRAHEGAVLCVHWSSVHGIILSGGEDQHYKLWDRYGHLLFVSPRSQGAITSVRWSPDGQYFAVGSFNMLRLCDWRGWSHSCSMTDSGSIVSLSWTPDGTQVAAGGANGAVCFGHVVDRQVEWEHVQVTQTEENALHVIDVLSDTSETLRFRDRVNKIALGYGHLVVVTTSQGCLYDVQNLNTPIMFDLKDIVNFVLLCEKCFVMVDNTTGIQVYNYEGTVLSHPKYSGLRSDCLNGSSMSLSNDTIAIIDRADTKVVRVLDVSNGKLIGEPIRHTQEVTEIALEQYGTPLDRKLALIDSNRDLYITPTHRPEMAKLGTMAESLAWNDGSGMLASITDDRVSLWLFPDAVYVDKDLLPQTKESIGMGEVGRQGRIQSFVGPRVTVRRLDGALLTFSVSPYPSVLYQLCTHNEWERAIRLCRFVKDSRLWACLGAMSILGQDLDTAEEAYAALEEADKLQHIMKIREIPSIEGRNAELFVFRRRWQEAEIVLLQAGLIYRAIKLNIRLFRWERALELALKYKVYVDMVLAYRHKYLAQIKQDETLQRFMQIGQDVEVEWETIKAKIAQEKERERQRPGAYTNGM